MQKGTIHLSVTSEGFTISGELKRVGNDLWVTVTGGDVPHIGTVTILTRELPLQTLRFPSHDGRFHKDDLLAEQIAPFIRPYLCGNCVISVGIHVNGITKKQIAASYKMAEELGKQIASWFRNNPDGSGWAV